VHQPASPSTARRDNFNLGSEIFFFGASLLNAFTMMGNTLTKALNTPASQLTSFISVVSYLG
jgi:hypothetical protein